MSLSNEVKLLASYINVENEKQNNNYKLSLLSKKLNWQKVLTLARQNGIVTLFYYNLKKTGREDLIPTKIRQEFEKSYFGISLQNICYFGELKKILLLLSSSGIEVVILKGMMLAHKVYANAALRPMADIDVLVKKQDVDQVENLLLGAGYMIGTGLNPRWYREHHHHLAPFHNPRSGICLEVHYDLLSPRKGIHLEINKVWQRAETERIDGIDTKILCAEDMLTHLCLHLFVSTCVGRIKHLVDIAQLLGYVKEDIDWDMIEKEASENHYIDYIYYSLYNARHLLGARIDMQILNRFRRRSSKNFFEDYLLKRVIAGNIINDEAFHILPKHYRGKLFTSLMIKAPIQNKLKSFLVFIFHQNNALPSNDSNSLISRISKPFNYIFILLSLISKFMYNIVRCILNKLSEKDILS